MFKSSKTANSKRNASVFEGKTDSQGGIKIELPNLSKPFVIPMDLGRKRRPSDNFVYVRFNVDMTEYGPIAKNIYDPDERNEV